MDEYQISILINMGLLSFIALSCGMLLIGGVVSFGQQAFFGIGAYVGGTASVAGGLPLSAALLLAIVAGALANAMLGAITLRLRGFYFSIASLAAAEAIRICLELVHLEVTLKDGETVGPRGLQGLGGVRQLYEQGFSASDFCLLIYALLLAVVLGLTVFMRGRFGVSLRMAGLDPELAATFGVDVRRIRLTVSAIAGAIAGLGGCLFVHYTTYVEPSNFGLMLGIHGIAYALIGGTGALVGPFLGVAFDILVLEASRVFQGYRMIVFGGGVALFLILRPRGILDTRTVMRLEAAAKAAFQSLRRNRGDRRDPITKEGT